MEEAALIHPGHAPPASDEEDGFPLQFPLEDVLFDPGEEVVRSTLRVQDPLVGKDFLESFEPADLREVAGDLLGLQGGSQEGEEDEEEGKRGGEGRVIPSSRHGASRGLNSQDSSPWTGGVYGSGALCPSWESVVPALVFQRTRRGRVYCSGAFVHLGKASFPISYARERGREVSFGLGPFVHLGESRSRSRMPAEAGEGGLYSGPFVHLGMVSFPISNASEPGGESSIAAGSFLVVLHGGAFAFLPPRKSSIPGEGFLAEFLMIPAL